MPPSTSRLAAVAAFAAALGLVLVAGPEARQERAALVDSLVQAERAFSTLSGKIGHVPAFLAYFADDVMTFQPAPAAGKERLRAAAARMAGPPPVRVDWEPWFADIADAGDLGYTTGPSIFTEVATGKVVRTGWYFSVWKKDAYGWRVAADIGTEAPPAGPLRPRTVDVGVSGAAFASPSHTRDRLLALERDLAAAVTESGLAKAYATYTGPSSRVHRDGTAPVVGEAAIAAFLAGQPKPIGWRALDAVVSSSRDIAYTLGECDLPPAPGAAAVKAGYLRVWKSGPRGWWLAADVVTR